MVSVRKNIKSFLYLHPLLVKVVVGYIIIAGIISGIIYVSIYEWKEVKYRKIETYEINKLKRCVHNVYVEMLELSLFSETFMEWTDNDFETYHSHQTTIDSMLCSLQRIYPNSHIDSIRSLWRNKGQGMRKIKELTVLYDESEQKIANQIPEIARYSRLENLKEKEEGFFKRLFKRRKKKEHTSQTTFMLNALNKEIIDKQQVYARELSEQSDSLAQRNRLINKELQQVMGDMNKSILLELQNREEKLAELDKRIQIIIAGLTIAMFVMLILSYIIIHRDMTHINYYKKKLENTISKLKQTISENEELIAARKRIMLTMTHDLRTPLTSIEGYAEMITLEENPAKRKDYSLAIHQVASYMSSMLNGLLDFFRLESGKEEIASEPFRLHSIIEILEKDFMPLAIKKNLVFKVEGSSDVVILGDRKRVIQIGYNLLSNAIKFTDSGSVILQVYFKDNLFNLIVEDTGTGMNEEEQQRIFTVFERLSNAMTKDGVGIGLSIVKNQVELLNGKIELTSCKGKGSCFKISIPMSLAENAVNNIHNETPYIKPFTVVALDNDTMLLSMLKEMYSRHGVMCTTCNNTRDLMELIRYQNYDLLITDLKMPEMNGFDVLNLLRISNVGNSRTIPVIAATAANNCDVEELLKAGFSSCLMKPFSSEELMKISLKCLGDDRQQEQINFHTLLEYDNRLDMLDLLINETRNDIAAIAECADKCDYEALKDWIHHLSSSWEIIHAGKPLRELFALLHSNKHHSVSELQSAVQAILEKGKEIIYLAQQAKESYESDCS